MTLVIIFRNAPILVGDLMLSNTNPEVFDKLPMRVRQRDNTPLYGAFPIQKIIRIRDGICIAYAGSMIDAKKTMMFARSLDWPSSLNLAKLEPLITRIREFVFNETHELQLIIYADGYYCHINGTEVLTPVGPAFVIGLGIKDFLEFLEQSPTFNPGHLAFPGNDCVVFALQFFSTLLIKHTTGTASLQNRWGLGLEILYRGTRYDRVLFQAFFWKKSERGQTRFTQIGAKIFNYYQGDSLINIWQWADGRSAVFKAAPLDYGYTSVRNVKDVPTLPQLTVTIFVGQSDSSSMRINIRHVPTGDNVCSVSKTQEGRIQITHSLEEVSRRFAGTSANLEARHTDPAP